jgi:hypothetical protein
LSWPDIKKKQMNISRVLIIRLKIQNLRYYECRELISYGLNLVVI